MSTTFIIKCDCGREHVINPAALLASIKSEAKSTAARENGRRGGRPKKNADPQK